MDNHIYIPEAELVNPSKEGSYRLLFNQWCVMFDNRLMLYKGFSPQCNSNKRTAESLQYCHNEHSELKFFERIFVPNED